MIENVHPYILTISKAFKSFILKASLKRISRQFAKIAAGDKKMFTNNVEQARFYFENI